VKIDILTDSLLSTYGDTLTKRVKNANRDTTPVRVSSIYDDTVTAVLTLPSKNTSFVRVSTTTLREEITTDIYGGNDEPT
jgi:hypothetical protein